MPSRRIFPSEPYGFPWPFPAEADSVSGFPGTPTNGELIAVDPGTPSVTIQFDGVPNAAGYRIYRSNTSPMEIGSQVNPTLVSQPGSAPWTFQYVDMTVTLAERYWYRAVAQDADGHIGLPSEALSVLVTETPSEVSDLRDNVLAYLQADAVLLGLVAGDTKRIRGQHTIDLTKDNFPILILRDGQFVEDNTVTEDCVRFGMQPMRFDAYAKTASNVTVEGILSRVAALLRDQAGGRGGRRAVSSQKVFVEFALVKDGMEEFYDSALRLHGKSLAVEFTVQLIQS